MFSDDVRAAGTVAVVGASGNVGSHVVRALAGAGVQVRALGVDVGRLRASVPDAVVVARLDLTDPTSFVDAVTGADRLFLLRPPAIARIASTISPFIDVAERCGVRHVVFSSVAGADSNRLLPHHRIERKLASTSMSCTILRPGFFAQNFADAYRADIVGDHRIFVPAGDAEVAFVDASDIGEIAATILSTTSSWEGAQLHLTGPEAVTFHDAAALLSSEIGRRIVYEPASVLGYFGHLVRRRRVSVAQAIVQTVLHVGLRRGATREVTNAVEDVLARPATALADYFDREHDTWRSASGPVAR